MKLPVDRTADVLLGGGVIAYPTESVFGLGCMPDNDAAITRLLEIKQRDPGKGLILIAASAGQFAGWVDDADLKRLPEPEHGRPITWIAAPGPKVTALVRGEHDGIAVRICTHPVAAAISRAVDSPITSTSANLSGSPVVDSRVALHRCFDTLVDHIAPGDCDPVGRPSEIRRLADGKVLRAGTA